MRGETNFVVFTRPRPFPSGPLGSATAVHGYLLPMWLARRGTCVLLGTGNILSGPGRNSTYMIRLTSGEVGPYSDRDPVPRRWYIGTTRR